MKRVCMMLLCGLLVAGCGVRSKPEPMSVESVKKPVRPDKHRVKLKNITRVSATESRFSIEIDFEP